MENLTKKANPNAPFGELAIAVERGFLQRSCKERKGAAMSFNYSNFTHLESAKAMGAYLLGHGWVTLAITNSGTGASWAVTATTNRTVRTLELTYLADLCRAIDRHQDLLKNG